MTVRTSIAAGFADPVHDAQHVFRSALEAISRPGRVQSLPALSESIPGLQPAAASLALALVDFETPVWLSPACRDAADFLRFHCGCTIVAEPAEACFAFASGWREVPPFDCFSLGNDVEPERSTTLVVEVEMLEKPESLVLTGPGIEQRQRLATGAIPADRIAERAALQALFPRGIDLFLTHDRQVFGLPRTTRVQILGSEACMSR